MASSDLNGRSGEEALRAVLRDGRTIFTVAVGFSLLCNLLRLSGPLFILLIHDRVLASGSRETLVVLFSLLVAFLITMGMVDYARRRLLARFGAQFQERVEELIFSATPKERLFQTNQIKPVAGLSDVDSIRGFFHSNGIIAVLDVVWAPIFLAVIFLFHWILGWVVVGGIALLFGVFSIKSAFADVRSKRAKASSKEIGALKNMLLTSRQVLKTQAMASGFSDRWLRARRASRDDSIALRDWTGWFSVFSRQIKLLLQYSVLAAGAFLVIGAETTVGAMIACMFLAVRVFVPVEQFLGEMPAIRRARRNWQYLKKRFAALGDNAEHRELWDLGGGLRLTNVAIRGHHTRRTVLRGVNLTAEPGSVIAITGGSGAGKSLLAGAMIGAVPHSNGTIEFGGAELGRLSADQASRLFAYLPESPRLIEGTIGENIAGLEIEPDDDSVFAAAKLAKIHDFIVSLRDGYATKIDPQNDGFSKGQRHLLALARALHRKSAVLIVDEPDIVVQMALFDGALDVLRHNGTAVIVLSRKVLRWLRYDRKYSLTGGRLKADKAAGKVIRMEKREVRAVDTRNSD